VKSFLKSVAPVEPFRHVVLLINHAQ